MRTIKALKADVLFQLKQGFYIVYIVLILIYMLIISQLPSDASKIAIPLIIFGDPSIVGFFFIGGIVMLEKIQGVLQYIVVTPLRIREYLLSKIISLSILGEIAGIIIGATTYRESINWLLLMVGILISSVFFTLLGFLTVTRSDSVNEYFIDMIPYMFIGILPCFSLIDFPYNWLFNIFPSVLGLRLIFGAFYGISAANVSFFIISGIITNILLFNYTENVFENRIVYGGESK
ncbi:ABC transporter permease [Clostridium sp. D2Q-14]|uniref:fluoroquinolone export ABC transporter permease subunit n=1 Tax=Anaeromonas gelatinilytica TaxID=2683194 RepID=UPI00193BCDDA|nr:ABC transporter permease [Anaeromonas gelatinilytica]MBS4535078.1 ABC transporter permease [Anaeromonas gelatinilytica]